MKPNGLYRKFNVTRVDGKDKPGEKHHGCRYFVLDIDHDPHARQAIGAYVQSLNAHHEHQGLACSLEHWLDTGEWIMGNPDNLDNCQFRHQTVAAILANLAPHISDEFHPADAVSMAIHLTDQLISQLRMNEPPQPGRAKD